MFDIKVNKVFKDPKTGQDMYVVSIQIIIQILIIIKILTVLRVITQNILIRKFKISNDDYNHLEFWDKTNNHKPSFCASLVANFLIMAPIDKE